MGDFFNEDQILGAVLFVVGMFLLSWLAKTEREQQAKMRDPRLKWSYIDAEGKKREEVKKRTSRSIIVTIIGGGMALYGFLSFLANVK
ncbi:MAG: hypothetical protein OEZ51_12760 [Nitrospinota bacterium]|nr:hypothetical protein [Nitrospinota bacterium]